MPTTQNVRVDVDLRNVSTSPGTEPTDDPVQDLGLSNDFVPIDVETKVYGSTVSNVAIIKGHMEDPEFLRRNQRVRVRVNDDEVFIGFVKFATQGFDDHEVTIEAYDIAYDLHDNTVTLQTEFPRFLTTIARRLLEEWSIEELGSNRVVDPLEDPEEVEPGSIYISPFWEFGGSNEDSPNEDIITHKQWGTGKGGEPLMDVLEEIADGLGATLWTDKRSVLRLEPVPDRQKLIADNIIDVEAGNEQNNDDKVREYLVGSSNAAVGSDSRATGQLSSTFRWGIVNNVSAVEHTHSSNRVFLRDDNIKTQEELETRAVSEYLNDTLQKSHHGTITVAGTTDVRPWDGIQMPDIEDVSIAAGDHVAAKVETVVNASDGFETRIQLVPEPIDVLNGATGNNDAAIDSITDLFTDSILAVRTMQISAL